MQLRIRQGVLMDILDCAGSEIPNECCGLPVGRGEQIKESALLVNLLAGPVGFFDFLDLITISSAGSRSSSMGR